MKFDENITKKIVLSDRYLSFVFMDLSSKNKHILEKDVLEIIFNSFIYEDSVFMRLYVEEFFRLNNTRGELYDYKNM